MRTNNAVKNKIKEQDNVPIPDHIDSTQLTIDPEGMQHIMSLLTNLYQNGALAIFREYIANGYDSHIKAETFGKKPIEVTIQLPTESLYTKFDGHTIQAKGTFSVKDYGTGMSHEDMLKIYSKYGNTTKNEDNNTIGGFGVGAKSALSITDYFEVISIKNGLKIVATIQLDATQVANMYIVSSNTTEETNGVEVRIPITHEIGKELLEESKSFFYAWPKNVITINGKEPLWTGCFENKERFLPLVDATTETVGWIQYLTAEGYEERHLPSRTKLTEERYSLDTSQPLGTYHFPEIFIGGIPYQMENKMLDEERYEIYKRWLSLGYSIHLNAPIGTLTLSPDRESIKTTEENRHVIYSLLQTVIPLVPETLYQHLQTLSEEKAYKFYYWNIAALNPKVNFPSWEIKPRYQRMKEELDEDYSLIPDTLYQNEVIPKKITLNDYFGGETTASLYVTDNEAIFSKIDFKIYEELNWLSFVTKDDPFKEKYRPTFHYSQNLHPYMSVFIYGRYEGKAANPISAYLTSALKAEGYPTTRYWYVISVDSEIEPPAIIKNSVPTYEINDLEKIAKESRKEIAKKRTIAKKQIVAGTKTRSSSIYPVGTYNSDTEKMDMELVTRKEYTEIDKEIILIDEAKIALGSPLLRFSGRRYRIEQNWSNFFKKTNLTKETRAEGFKIFDLFSKEWPNSYLTFVPASRTSEVLSKANENTILLENKINNFYNNQDKEGRQKLAVMYALYEDPLSLQFMKEEIWKDISEPYLYSIYKELTEQETEISRMIFLVQFLAFRHRLSMNPYSKNAEFPQANKIRTLAEIFGSTGYQNISVKIKHYNKMLELPEFRI
jgi:hypothetical protein